MQATRCKIQNENCRLRVKGTPGIKCTHCHFDFWETSLFKLACCLYNKHNGLCYNRDNMFMLKLELLTHSTVHREMWQNVSQILAMCCSTKLPHYHISKVFIYITLVATLGSRGYFFLIDTVCASLTRLCCEPSVSIRKKYPLEPRVSSSRRKV